MDFTEIPNWLIAIAAVMASIVGVLNYRETRRNGQASSKGRAEIKEAVRIVDVKADGMLEQTNGHLTQLIAAVVPLDPKAAEIAAKKIEETAEKVAARLAESKPQP